MQLVDSCVAIGGPKRDGESRLDGIRLHRLTGFSELFPPLWGAAQLRGNVCVLRRCRLVWFDPGGCVPLSPLAQSEFSFFRLVTRHNEWKTETVSFFRSTILPILIVALFGLALFAVSARIWLPGDMLAPAPVS